MSEKFSDQRRRIEADPVRRAGIDSEKARLLDDRVFSVRCDELGPGLHDMVPLERAERAEQIAADREWERDEAEKGRDNWRDAAHDSAKNASALRARVIELEEREEHLLHGICDALDDGHPTKPILRALLKGTEHEGHEKQWN